MEALDMQMPELPALPTVLACIDECTPFEVQRFFRCGVWCVAPYIYGYPATPSQTSCVVMHIPTGVSVGMEYSSDDAFNLCRLLGERWPDYDPGLPFGGKPGSDCGEITTPEQLALIEAWERTLGSTPTPERV